MSGGTTTINGACIKTGTIDAERLNLTGAISFADLEQDVIEEITGGITQDQVKTLINSTLVQSPTIAGGKFYNLAKDTWLEIGRQKAGYDGLILKSNAWGDDPIFAAYDADFGMVSFVGKGCNFMTTNSTTETTIPRGIWDFSRATVAGLSMPSWSVVSSLSSDYSDFYLIVTFAGVSIVTPTYKVAMSTNYYAAAGDPTGAGVYSMHVNISRYGDVTVDNVYRVEPGKDQKVIFNSVTFTIYAR